MIVSKNCRFEIRFQQHKIQLELLLELTLVKVDRVMLVLIAKERQVLAMMETEV